MMWINQGHGLRKLRKSVISLLTVREGPWGESLYYQEDTD